MDSAAMKKWLAIFCGILATIMIADYLSGLLVATAGIGGWARYIFGFVVYAVLFFAILYAIERITGISFFGFGRNDW